MSRIVIHPGFHKTGTSSLQDFLRQNRHLLADHLTVVLPDEIVAPAAAAMAYGRLPLRRRRRTFAAAFRGWLAGQPREQTLFVSCEALLGPMPGHLKATGRMIRGYRAAPALLGEICAAAPEAEIWLTTRRQKSWAQSVHGHILRSRALTLDEDSFARRIDSLRQAVTALDDVRPVRVFPLEDSAEHALGPAGPILGALGLPADLIDGLPGARRTNRGDPADRRDDNLTLNRSRRNKAALRRAKAERPRR